MTKYGSALFALMALWATSVQASPIVTVTVKNMGSLPMQLRAINNNHIHTLANSTPSPQTVLPVGGIDTFKVDNQVGENANYAELHYKMRDKECNFRSLFVNKYIAYKSYIPQWFKNADAQYGAKCTADIVSANPGEHSWHVIFTMK